MSLLYSPMRIQRILRKCLEYIEPCHFSTGTSCDDPEAGKDKSEWCGGPCRLREEIREVLENSR